MPEIITCPDCGRKLRVPDELAGKQVKCPGCNIRFVGGVTSAPKNASSKSPSSTPRRVKVDDKDADHRVAEAPGARSARRPTADDDDEQRSSRRRRAIPVNNDAEDEDNPYPTSEYDEDNRSRPKRRKIDGWRKVLLGLNLVIYAIYVCLGAAALALVSVLIAFVIMGASLASADPRTMAGSAVGSMFGVMILAIIIGVLYLVQLVLHITGQGICMAVPDKPGSGRRPLAIATFSCAIAWVVLYLGSCGLSGLASGIGNSGGGAATVLGGLLNLLNYFVALAWWICFLLFLRSVAVSMRENALALQIVYYMIAVPTYSVLVGIMIGVMFFAGALAVAGAVSAKNGQGAATSMGAFGVFAVGCGILFVCVGIGLFIWYVVLVHQVRNSVRRYLE
jgi:hypothetical protein